MDVVKLEEGPCVVKYLPELCSFVVGTYQLVEDSPHLATVNNRIGSLYLVENSKHLGIKHRHVCRHGGVFDLKRYPAHPERAGEDPTAHIRLFVAHSNGFVAQYLVRQNDIVCEQAFDIVSAKLLTSLDLIIPFTPNFAPVIVSGDSDGHINIISSQRNQIVASCVSVGTYSVWQVKCVPFADGRCNLLFVGADDSVWRIYLIRAPIDHTPGGEDLLEFKVILLHVNKDFKAGVTSFETTRLSDTTTITFEDKFVKESFDLLVGSYDETIRSYRLSTKYNVETLDFEVKTVYTSSVTVPGGGIWRIKHVNDETVLVAAMHAGSFRFQRRHKSKAQRVPKKEKLLSLSRTLRCYNSVFVRTDIITPALERKIITTIPTDVQRIPPPSPSHDPPQKTPVSSTSSSATTSASTSTAATTSSETGGPLKSLFYDSDMSSRWICSVDFNLKRLCFMRNVPAPSGSQSQSS